MADVAKKKGCDLYEPCPNYAEHSKREHNLVYMNCATCSFGMLDPQYGRRCAKEDGLKALGPWLPDGAKK